MKKIIGIITIASLAPLANAGEVLHVKANQVYQIGPNQGSLLLDELILEDNAVIRFSPGVKQWVVSAGRASIGSGVVIQGDGTGGQHGSAGGHLEGSTADCRDGLPGVGGGDGVRGEDGVSVSLRLALASLGDLTVSARGGNGGNGGSGSDGQKSGSYLNCDPPGGGDGGNGGLGGDGGNGGSIRIQYTILPGSELPDDIGSKLRLVAAGGHGGKGSAGGAGGEAAPGRYVHRRTLTGSRQWVDGGDAGEHGVPGREGGRGLIGQVAVEPGHAESHPEVAVVSKAKGRTSGESADNNASATHKMQADEVFLLKNDVKMLQNQLREMERLLRSSQARNVDASE